MRWRHAAATHRTLGADAQTLLRLLYDDEGVFYRRYHAAVSKDGEARVSRWAPAASGAPPVAGLPPPAEGELTRSVSFVKRMELPAAITRVMGAWNRGHIARASARPRSAKSPPALTRPWRGARQATSAR